MSKKMNDSVEDSKETKKKQQKVRLYVTGYGVFSGANDKNPSGAVVERLIEEKGYTRSETELLCVLKSTVQSIDIYVDEVVRRGDSSTNNSSLFVSIGVHDVDDVVLERVAYNETDFPAPDENGYMPRKGGEIVPNGENVLETNIDVDDICQRIRAQHVEYQFQTSNDPGRYMCNYIFYKSLNKNPNSLFVHVPPFEKMSQDELYPRIVALLEELIRQQQQQQDE